MLRTLIFYLKKVTKCRFVLEIDRDPQAQEILRRHCEAHFRSILLTHGSHLGPSGMIEDELLPKSPSFLRVTRKMSPINNK